MPKYHSSDTRRRAKRSTVNSEHSDRYADKRVDAGERRIAELLAELAAHFNGEDSEEADHA